MRSGRWVVVVLACALALALAYLGMLAWATAHGVAQTAGDIRSSGVHETVTIARDARGIPHIRARTAYDFAFAQGYAQGSDRLFQLDLLRRYVTGRLAEVLGSPVVAVDRQFRLYRIAHVAQTSYEHAPRAERAMLEAFSDGVNAAARTQPLPVEFRALFIGFEPWKPSDSLAVGYSTALNLVDDWQTIRARDRVRAAFGDQAAAWYPLTDPAYDVAADGRPGAPVPRLPDLHAAILSPVADGVFAHERPPIGSNDWAVGAQHTSNHRAVLANDPHLDLTVPGIWYLWEGRAGATHVAGASLVGTPGVTLGHNEHVAWGATNGGTTAMRVYAARSAPIGRHIRETIAVRFGAPVTLDLRETVRGITAGSNGRYAETIDWAALRAPTSPLTAFLALDDAASARDAARIMRRYTGPTQNFVFADDAGNAAYHMAGPVVSDPLWGTAVHHEGYSPERAVPYDALPAIAASPSTIVLTANNRPGATRSPLRLAASFIEPYRAFEIAARLRPAWTGHRMSPAAIGAIQADTHSVGELELARRCVTALRGHVAASDPWLSALAAWNGDLVSQSRAASAIVMIREAAINRLARLHFTPTTATAWINSGPAFGVLLRALRERPRGWVSNDDYDEFLRLVIDDVRRPTYGALPAPFGTFAAAHADHPLAAFGLRWWNAGLFIGHGGSFSPAVQWHELSQSFRALWIPGDWDAGGIDIPVGESGEPGSPHYRDAMDGWQHFTRTPLPFSDAAVERATREVLTLRP